MKVRPVIPATICLLGVAGGACFGHGLWIYAKAELAQLLLERAWVDTRRHGGAVPPWPWADTWPVARLAAPEHGVEAIVLAGGSGRTMAFGPAHLDASADPGRLGNCVLAGHRDTHFAFLEHLAEGDSLLLERSDGRVVRYAVRDVMVIRRDETWVAEQSGGYRLTLVTCYPFRDPVPGGPLRFVVRAEAVASRGIAPSTMVEGWRNARNRLTYSPAGRSDREAISHDGEKTDKEG